MNVADLVQHNQDSWVFVEQKSIIQVIQIQLNEKTPLYWSNEPPI